jgi:hypothetical protein
MPGEPGEQDRPQLPTIWQMMKVGRAEVLVKKDGSSLPQGQGIAKEKHRLNWRHEAGGK